jgi:hypothetical protein
MQARRILRAPPAWKRKHCRSIPRRRRRKTRLGHRLASPPSENPPRPALRARPLPLRRKRATSTTFHQAPDDLTADTFFHSTYDRSRPTK